MFGTSAVAQVCLWFISWLMVLGGFLFGILGLLAGLLWVIGDAFLMPGLVRSANERTRRNAIGYTFA
ncbi:hypothetical protein RCO27_09165 [Sphingosinicella sp. LHD-64]|uniref:hypothetical protein n=1 Tax=Sphingosinicella sp. LHD-64 TaxID=3072139 RepID=UPI00280FCE8A|nr:hypothetical protein [Sphingosinicella sp. LHD-64]MDQ8756399.1 hypothetical protein [Sphingosinicella sp. LHD-64]